MVATILSLSFPSHFVSPAAVTGCEKFKLGLLLVTDKNKYQRPVLVKSISDKASKSISVSMDVKTTVDCFNEIEQVNNDPSVATLLMNFDTTSDPYASMSTPLYQTATFKQPSATDMGPYDYTRSGNPTRDVLERLLAQLDKADRAFCFTSGMAALAAVPKP